MENRYPIHTGEDFNSNVRFTVLLFSFYWPAHVQNLNQSTKFTGNVLGKAILGWNYYVIPAFVFALPEPRTPF